MGLDTPAVSPDGGRLAFIRIVIVLCVALAGCAPGGGESSVQDLDRRWVEATGGLDAALTELLGDVNLEPPPGQAFLPWFEHELPRLSAATDRLSAAYRDWQTVTDAVLDTGIEVRGPSQHPIGPASIREFGSAVAAVVSGYEQQRDLVGGCVKLADGNEDAFTRCFLRVLAQNGDAWHRNGLRVMNAAAGLGDDS